MAIHSLYRQSVTLDRVEHRYYDEGGKEYLSFSRLFGFLSPKFDAENIAKHVARSEGTTSEVILGQWQKATDEGTRLDAAIKLFTETGRVAEENKELEEVIKKVCFKYKDYHAVYSDLVVFDEKSRTAGEIDRLSLTSNRKDGSFHISDFKRFKSADIFGYKGQKWLNYPFAHHLNSKYNKISWQLSFYANHFEKLTGRKCERLFIDLIIPILSEGKIVGYHNQEVPVAYLKSDVDNFLDHFSNRIKDILEPKQIIIEDEF